MRLNVQNTLGASLCSPPRSAAMGNYHWALWEVEDIVGFILQRLPLTELIQARLVCRRWNRVVLSQRSKIAWCYEMYNGVMDYKQSRLLVRRSEGRLFDPFLLSWRKVSAPPLSHANIDGYVLNSSGECGLIALCERPRRNNPDGPTTRFWVGNPLINKWKCIPGSPRFVISNDVPVSFLHFIVSEGPPVSYMIVAIVPERREVRFGMHAITRTCGVNVIIYSSITQEWRFGATTTTFRQWYPAGSSLNNGRIFFVSHRYVKGSYRTGMVSYSLEHDEFDLVGQAPTERNNMSMLGILVEDNQVPALYCVVRHPCVKEPTLEFYEFEPNEQGQGWESKNTSKYDALKEGLPATGAYELRFTGNAEQKYALVRGYKLDFPSGLFQFDRHACRFIHRPFTANSEGGQYELDYHEKRQVTDRMCSFIPRFDVRP